MSVPEPQKLGEFEILEKLGHGGMGAVYKARQSSLGRLVALKVLPPHMASDEEFITRFKAEARSAASLNHPGIVQVYAAGEDHGMHYFAMEFVDGESLYTRLKRKGRIAPVEALAICAHVATALNHAWQKARVIHRDIKPDNIFLSSEGDVKLGDLGLAKSVIGDSQLTRTGASMGTPYYISPEQAHGDTAVDFRSDIYSLGCTLYHLLTGETPYTASSPMAVMIKHITQPAPDIVKTWPDCPRGIAPLLARMLAKDPADRPQSYEELIRDLMAAHTQIRNAPASRDSTRKLPATDSHRAVAQPAAEAREERKSQRLPLPKKLPYLIGIGVLIAGSILLAWAPWRKTTPSSTPAPAAATSAVAAAATPAPAPALPESPTDLAKDGFIPLFNGRDLSGWDGDPKIWSVQDGAIVGEATPANRSSNNAFLLWKGGPVEDFILQASVQISAGGCGVQYRSRLMDPATWALAGYQMNISADRREWRGALYEERGTRGVLAEAYGEYVRWRSFGVKEILRRDGGTMPWQSGGWNTLRITARGNRLVQEINGVTTVEIVDEDPARQSLSGLIGLQILTSNNSAVRFRDIQLKRLTTSSTAPQPIANSATPAPAPTPTPTTPAPVIPPPLPAATPAPIAAPALTSRLNPGGGIVFEGGSGPGAGKHIVLLAGDEEYRSEEMLPQLAKILAQHHGFKCTVLFSIDPQTGEIDPAEYRNMPGLEALATADLCIPLIRFRNWPDAQMRYFVDYYLAGKPFVALRTSTHAFNGIPASSPYQTYNYNNRIWLGGFGKQVLGETWLSHWGAHKSQATRAIIEPAATGDPILRGVTSFIGPTDVYEAYPPADARILLRGQVLSGMTEIGGAATNRKRRIDGQEQNINSPMMPVAWTREPRNPLGRTNRVFTCTMGTAAELQEANFRRLLINATYWALGLTDQISSTANVSLVGNYTARDYGFDGFAKGVKPADLLLPGSTISKTSTASPGGATSSPVGQKIVLFDGRDTSAWQRDDGKPCDWPIVNGALDVGSISIATKEKFRDFQLHTEFWIPRYPPSVTGQSRGNSGVYLQRRYEIQILDSFGLAPTNTDCGAIYKFRAPSTNASTGPETWQSFDIFFRAARFDSANRKTANARVTVIHNGITIHSDVEIPDATGMGSSEGSDPGPILLQSNVGKARFRNIWIIPL